MKTLLSLCLLTFTALASVHAAGQKVTKFARFQLDKTAAYGVVEGEVIHEIAGNLFGDWKRTGKTHPLARVKLLPPTRPSKILAMAGNYRSHHSSATIDPKFDVPQLFFKPPSCLIPHGANIVIPKGTTNVHHEAELVVVIGKRARNVPKEKALDYVFGATCGNDISARDWQKGDVQWWRAKGSDTFGPCGPFVVSGLNFDDLDMQMRVNGDVRQHQRTRDLIHNVAAIVSFASQHATLEPGDLIYTGTPGTTTPIKPGDVCEVEIEGIGVLRNKVVAAP